MIKLKSLQLEAEHSIECITHASHASAAPSCWVSSQRSETAPHGLLRLFAPFDLWGCNPNPIPFDLIFIDGRGTVMDYSVPSLAILVSAVLILSCGQNHRQNYRGGWTRRREFKCENYINFGATFVCILVVSSYVRKCLYSLRFKLTAQMWLLLIYCLAASASGSTALASVSNPSASASGYTALVTTLATRPNRWFDVWSQAVGSARDILLLYYSRRHVLIVIRFRLSQSVD